MADILERLEDLHKQATEERSHFYTGKCIKDAINEIKFQRWLANDLANQLASIIKTAGAKCAQDAVTEIERLRK